MAKPFNPAAIAESLKNLAKARGEDTRLFQSRFVMERLILRIDAVDTDGEMMLCGGMLAHLTPGLESHARSTTDIDLRSRETAPETERVVDLIRSAFRVDLSDGVTFELRRVEGGGDATHDNGLKLHMRAYLGTVTDPNRTPRADFHVDVAFGGRRPSSVKRVTFERSMHPSLPGGSYLSCGMPYQIAEKISAAVRIGAISTRMKDYRDLWMVATGRTPCDRDDLGEALSTILEDRAQPLADEARDLPGYADQFAADHQADWAAWVRASRMTGQVPDDLAEVVATVRSLVDEALDGVRTPRGENAYGPF